MYTKYLPEKLKEGARLKDRREWEDNIRMDRRYIVWEIVDWIHLVQDRGQWQAFVKTVMNIRVS
jgi:hypothetical protein